MNEERGTMNGDNSAHVLDRSARRIHRSSLIAHRSGFTLLELLVALVLLSIAFTIVASTFFGTMRAWRRGGELLEGLHNGDFVMEHMVSALRSAAFFKDSSQYFGFWLNSGGGSYPRDEISWVTSGTTFLPPDSELANGLYRISITVEDNEDGDDAVAVRAYPYMADMEPRDVDPWFISTRVKGIDCRVYNLENDAWEDEWEDTNSLPSLVELTLFMQPLEKYEPPITLQRLVEIPIAPSVTGAVSVAQGGDIPDQAGSEPAGGASGGQAGTAPTGVTPR